MSENKQKLINDFKEFYITNNKCTKTEGNAQQSAISGIRKMSKKNIVKK